MLAPQNVDAAFAVGTLSFAQRANVVYTGSTVATDPNTFTIPGSPNINVIPATGDFASLSGTTGNVSAIVSTPVRQLQPFTITAGGFTFSVLSGTFVVTPPDVASVVGGLGVVSSAPLGFDAGNVFTISFSIIQNRDIRGRPTTVTLSGSLTTSDEPFEPPVPEPASLALAGVAAAGLGLRKIRRRKTVA